MVISRVFLGAFLFIICSGVFAEDYKIVFSHPSKVGDKSYFKGSGTSQENMTMSSGDKVLRESKTEIKASLSGVSETLEVNDSKKPSKIKFTVEKCLASISGAPDAEILQKDSEIIMELKNKKTVYLFHGKPLPPNITKVLALFLSLSKGEISDDDVFGTKERKKVGDSWKVNSKAAAAGLAEEGLKVSPESITGKVKFLKVDKVGNTKCPELSADLKMVGVRPPLPPAVKVEKSEITANMHGLITPEGSDKSYDPMWTVSKMKMEVIANGRPNPNSPLLNISMKISKNVKETSTNLK